MTETVKKIPPVYKNILPLAAEESENFLLHRDYAAHSYESLKLKDSFIKESVSFEDLRGFLKYVETYKGTETAIFLNTKRIKASFDYHNNKSNYNKHHAEFVLEADKRFLHWVDSQNEWFTQKDFCDFLDSGLNEVVNPSQAELIDLIRNLRATTKHEVSFQQKAGYAEVGYNKATSVGSIDKSGVTIPEYFEIACLPYKGLTSVNADVAEEFQIPSYQTKVKLGFRTSEEGSRLEFKYTVLASERLVEQTQEAVKKLVAHKFESIKDKIFIGG